MTEKSKNYSEQEIKDIVGSATDGVIFDLVAQLNNRHQCFLCMSSGATPIIYAYEEDASTKIFVCDLCAQKIDLYKEHVQMLFKN